MKFFCILLLLIVPTSLTAKTGAADTKNSWRGIRPLQSSAADVSRLLGVEPGPVDDSRLGPIEVDGGEVTITYLTTGLAKIYRAPRSLIGKVFTIYFKPSQPVPRSEIKLSRSFKQCNEEAQKYYYYFVSDAGVAYQLRRASDSVETIIYQPSRAEISRLAVNTECVF
ncbi:MAG TPA: hypothetical protein VF131_07165 [Blastocatellia bacterium]|nr:hypothetical protein [Blastocatellia bacterium]